MFIFTLSDILDVIILGLVAVGVIIFGIFVGISKATEAIKDSRTQEQLRAELEAKEKAAKEAKEHERLLSEQKWSRRKKWAKRHPLLSRYLDFQSRHTILMAILYGVFVPFLAIFIYGLIKTKIAP